MIWSFLYSVVMIHSYLSSNLRELTKICRPKLTVHYINDIWWEEVPGQSQSTVDCPLSECWCPGGCGAPEWKDPPLSHCCWSCGRIPHCVCQYSPASQAQSPPSGDGEASSVPQLGSLSVPEHQSEPEFSWYFPSLSPPRTWRHITLQSRAPSPESTPAISPRRFEQNFGNFSSAES